jgi:hypothetical protein
MGHGFAVYSGCRKLYKTLYSTYGCFRIFDSLFGKKEEKKVEKKAKAEITAEPPKEEYKCKYLYPIWFHYFINVFHLFFFYPVIVFVSKVEKCILNLVGVLKCTFVRIFIAALNICERKKMEMKLLLT